MLKLVRECQKSHTNNEEITELAADKQEGPISIDISCDPETAVKQNNRQESKKETKKKPIPIDLENLMLVAAVLIATVTYQAGLTPPSTIWKGGEKYNGTCSWKADKNDDNLLQSPIDCPPLTYYFFIMFNSAGFFSSVFLIIYITYRHPYHHPMHLLNISILSVVGNYIMLMWVLFPDIPSQSFVLILPVFLVSFGFALAVLLEILREKDFKCIVKKLKSKIKKPFVFYQGQIDARLAL